MDLRGRGGRGTRSRQRSRAKPGEAIEAAEGAATTLIEGKEGRQ